MKISLVRTGGVAGMRREATIDTAHLGPRDSEEIHRLVTEAADEPALAKTSGRPSGADRFHYTLTIEDGGRRRALTFEEERTPERLRPLLDAVWRVAAAGSGSGPQSA
ncbi:MAG TPA: protealysin inhibitor emfourin [Thermoanaerobaculia bacterium]